METIILCGGKGTRMRGFGEIPKPMIPVGGIPVLRHIMNYYASYGYRNFNLCLGYKGSYISDYFAENMPSDWHVRLWETGLDTSTLGRLSRLRNGIHERTFFLTYGDGISDVNLEELVRFHMMHGKLMTLVGIRKQSSFGIVHYIENTVVEFQEKPTMNAYQCINGGFFVCNHDILDMIPENTSESLEEYLLPFLASEGQLKVYHHDGFWQCMDDYHDWFLLDKSYLKGGSQWGN